VFTTSRNKQFAFGAPKHGVGNRHGGRAIPYILGGESLQEEVAIENRSYTG